MAGKSQTKARSLKQEQLLLTSTLRDEGKSWRQIAQAVSEKYDVNARVAFRIAHGWTQPRAAEKWTRLWPTDPKTFKNFSYWEQWPGGSGHTPSLETLAKLAQLYQCHLADLLFDCEDFRNLDPIYQTSRYANALPELLHETSNTTSRDPRERDLANIIAYVQDIEVTDLAKIAATWSKDSGSEETRRSALLKLSAGLSLAATSPFLASVPAEALSKSEVDSDLSGIWLSSYTYFSTSRDKTFEDSHYVVLRQDGNSLIAQSLENTANSHLQLTMTLKNYIVTGSWSEKTSPKGHYKGATYHGTLQMVTNPMGRSMTGKWVGFNKDFQVESGDWRLRWIDGSTSKRTQERYHNKI
jgi:transcriptional regulator with XRE-family HTH domain